MSNDPLTWAAKLGKVGSESAKSRVVGQSKEQVTNATIDCDGFISLEKLIISIERLDHVEYHGRCCSQS